MVSFVLYVFYHNNNSEKAFHWWQLNHNTELRTQKSHKLASSPSLLGEEVQSSGEAPLRCLFGVSCSGDEPGHAWERVPDAGEFLLRKEEKSKPQGGVMEGVREVEGPR